MKKRTLLLVAAAALLCFTACGGKNTASVDNTQKEMTEPEADNSEAYFEWDGNIIIGLTEQGAAQTSIVIPERCEGFDGMSFVGTENSITEVSFESDKNIKLNAIFANAKSIKKITLPANLETIGDREFWLCTSLESIKMPATVESIGESAFKENTSLTQVEFAGNAITEIGPHVFWGCPKLAEIALPDSVTKIGEYAFYQCKALEMVELPKALSHIGDFAYADSGLKNLYIDAETELTAYDSASFTQLDHSVDVYVSKGAWADLNFDEVFSGAFKKNIISEDKS